LFSLLLTSLSFYLSLYCVNEGKEEREIYTCRIFLLINFKYHLMECRWHNFSTFECFNFQFHLYSAIFFLSLIELARDALNSKGYCVIGGYMSPVNDAYKKKVCRCLTETEKNRLFISIHVSGKFVRKTNH
jgi:hypothetical protein